MLPLTAAGGKRVEITHAAAVKGASALAAELGITLADTILVLHRTLACDPVSALWIGLIAGARIVLAPAEADGDGARLRRLIRAEEVTFLQASPREWESLIDSGLRLVRGLRALCGGGRGDRSPVSWPGGSSIAAACSGPATRRRRRRAMPPSDGSRRVGR